MCVVVLDTTITTEVELIQLLKSSASDIEERGWDVIHQHDDPTHISLLPAINPQKVNHLLKRLSFLNIEQNEHVDMTETDNWQTQASSSSSNNSSSIGCTVRVVHVETYHKLLL